MTARPHPHVMTIQPAFWALDRFSNTPATTPLPSRIRSAVPIVSAPKMLKDSSSTDVVALRRADPNRRGPAMSNQVQFRLADRVRVQHRRTQFGYSRSRAMAGRIQSIERAAAILRLLSGRNRRLGVVQLAGELELPKA